MKIPGSIFAMLAMLFVSAPGFADIYKSKDAEGNTVFTDVPTEGAKEVDVQPINTADAPPDMPHPTPKEPAAPAAGPASQQTQQGGVTIIGDAHNERVERAVEEHRREEVRDAVERHEVGDGEQVEHHAEGELLRRTPPAAQPHVGGHGRRH